MAGMSKEHLEKLFSALGLVLLFCTLNSWLASQGVHPILGLPLLTEERPPMAFFGLAMASILTILLCTVGWLHARRHGTNWSGRVPVVWLDGLDTGQPDAKIYQAVVLVLFLLVPTAASVHFAQIIFSSKLCILGTRSIASVPEAWLGSLGHASQTRLVADLSADATCNHGIQVFAPAEFLILIMLCVLAIVLMLLLLIAAFWGRRSASAVFVSTPPQGPSSEPPKSAP